ncbi:acyl transferase [uncultured Eudoraea sp.]|jgi:phenylacetate-coenzyme A ligase PaaK-like adenylate-forming protein|uniref:LuxE/PaaK family acyltransferase n=1 Tax=uncultured Eudoraea sp. TaxID=1035614 RepID=UPI00262989C6|nr:acyl transferase [uncultured Eudoraea sp.]
MDINRIFEITNSSQFNKLALEIFNFQYDNNTIYRNFCDYLGKSKSNVTTVKDIPYLPIEFFKSKKVITKNQKPQIVFESSGTTGQLVSKHYVSNLAIYVKSYLKTFEYFYGNIEDYCVLALLPSYMEREGSSLIYMVKDLIKKSRHPKSGFYLDNKVNLLKTLINLDQSAGKNILIGVSYALLDLSEDHSINLKNTIIMETGGMKGRRTELVRDELHSILKRSFGLDAIHSEYGMTELLSQAYSKANGIFNCPPWMSVSIRETEDPLTTETFGKIGGINIIDLANIYSCSFIATQDLGRVYKDGSFEVLGRFDHSDVRGCNLMVL